MFEADRLLAVDLTQIVASDEWLEICDNFDKCRGVCYSPRKLSPGNGATTPHNNVKHVANLVTVIVVGLTEKRALTSIVS